MGKCASRYRSMRAGVIDRGTWEVADAGACSRNRMRSATGETPDFRCVRGRVADVADRNESCAGSGYMKRAQSCSVLVVRKSLENLQRAPVKVDFDRFCGTYVAMWQIAWQLENESATYFFPRFRAILGIVSMWQLFLIYLTREEKRIIPFHVFHTCI